MFLATSDDSNTAAAHWKNDAPNVVALKQFGLSNRFFWHQQDRYGTEFSLDNKVRHFVAVNNAIPCVGDNPGVVIQDRDIRRHGRRQMTVRYARIADQKCRWFMIDMRQDLFLKRAIGHAEFTEPDK